MANAHMTSQVDCTPRLDPPDKKFLGHAHFPRHATLGIRWSLGAQRLLPRNLFKGRKGFGWACEEAEAGVDEDECCEDKSLLACVAEVLGAREATTRNSDK